MPESPLVFDIEFNAAGSAAEAEQALQGIQDSADALGRSISDAFDSAQQVVTTLASASVGDLEQLTLFGDAAANADQLAAGLTSAADAGQTAAQAASDVAAGMDEARSAVDELATGAADTGTQLQLFGDQQDKISESVQQTTESQRQQTEETSKGVDLAGRLSAEFERIHEKVSDLAGPMGRFTDEALKAVAGMEGISGLAVGGLAAGAIGLLAAGESFHSAAVSITQATGATGESLHGLEDSFKTALEGSGRSAGDLAQILGTLNRDTGETGDALAEVTDQTAKFLKVTNGGVGDVRGLTQALRALGGDATDLSPFEDELATATTHFGTSVSTLVSQLKTAGPILSTFGFDRGQVVGLVGELDQAGLSVQRLVPGLTKLATTASGEGKTAAQALTDLIDKIKGAGDSQAALNEVQGVFSGRVAAGFVTAVRNGTVDIGKLNAIMAESPGTVDRLGESVKGLSAQFGLIRNDILASFGQAGLPLLEGLRQGIEDIRPVLHDLFQVLGDLSPLFKGFATAAFLPVEALRLLGPPLELLDKVLSHIPAPLLEAVGAMAAFKVLPFGFITQGLSGLGTALAGIASGGLTAGLSGAGEAASGALGGIGTAVAAINPLTLIAGAGLVGLFGIMHERSQNAAEAKARLEALSGALGTLSISATDAGPKLDAALQAGSKGHLLSDSVVAALGDAGVSLQHFRELLQSTATAPEQDVTKALRQSLLDASGGIAGLIDKFGNLPTIDTGPGVQHLGQLAAETAKTADGQKQLTDEFLSQGTVLGQLDPKLKKIIDSFKDLEGAANEDARKKLANFIGTHDEGAADVQAALGKLKLADATGHEAEVLATATGILQQHTAAKFGLAGADEKVNEATGAALDGLEAEGALHDQVAGAADRQAKLLNELAAASTNGVASDKDRVAITKELVAGGLSTEDATKKVAEAEQKLADLQAKHTPVTQAFNDALRNTFEQIGHGTGEWQALTGASQTFGVNIEKLEPAFVALNQQLQQFAPPVKAGDDVMGQLLHDMQQGLPIQTTFNDLMAVSGGNSAVAFAALNDYKKGVDDTKKALDGLAPSLGSVVSKLQDQADAVTGPNAEGAALALKDAAKARKDGIDAEIQDLQDQKQARSDADQASIDAQKAALQNQKSLAQDAAKARGEAFDSTGIDLQIKALKARTDTADLDAQIKDLEGRQKDVDADLARAQAALAPFQAEEAAINANARLRDTDLAQQQAQLAQARDLAQQQAAARGAAFDPTPLNNRINDLQVQRDQIASLTAGAIASAEGTSAKVQADVEKAQGGILDFQTVLDTFDAQNVAKAQEAATVAQLRADGMTATLQTLFDPNNGLSEADQNAFLQQIATASPEERAAIEAHAAASLQLVQQKNDAISKASDIFAQPNPEFVTHATARGNELAKGMAEGFVQTLDDSKINEIIDLVIKTGVDPVAARKTVMDQIAAAKAAAGGPAAPTLAGVGISAEQVQGAEQALGGAGTTAGALFVQNTQDAIKNTTIDPDAAAAMLQPVQDQLPVEGAAGGASVASTVGETIKNSPIDADAASVLVANVQTQLPVEGSAGGAGYATSVPTGMALYPVPSINGTILVASVGAALTVAGTDAGANYALSVAAGIAAKQGDAIEAAHLAAIRVDAAGHAGLEAASPSKKGLRLGGFWVEGIALGITQNLDKVKAAAFSVGEAVSAPLPTGQLVGAGVGAAAAASGAGAFKSNGTATSVHIENVNVTGTTNATGDDVATALSRKIGWLGITGRAEL